MRGGAGEGEVSAQDRADVGRRRGKSKALQVRSELRGVRCEE